MMANLVRSASEVLSHSRPDLWVVEVGTRVDVTICVSKGIDPSVILLFKRESDVRILVVQMVVKLFELQLVTIVHRKNVVHISEPDLGSSFCHLPLSPMTPLRGWLL